MMKNPSSTPANPWQAPLTKFLTIISDNYIQVQKYINFFKIFLGVSAWEDLLEMSQNNSGKKKPPPSLPTLNNC